MCLICSICFSGFGPEKSSLHVIADNLNEFLSFDGLPNALNRRSRALQNKLTLAEVTLENKALFHKSCIAVYKKQKLSTKWTGGCNKNLEDKKRVKTHDRV